MKIPFICLLLFIGQSLIADVICSGTSGPVKIDSRIEPTVDHIDASYNSSWIGGDPSAEVVISADGKEIKRTTGVGEFAWLSTASGKHTLTYTTFINGVAQNEVYEVTVYADWKYTIEDGKATIVEASQWAGDVAIPSEIDGYPVVAVDENVFANCTGFKSATLPLAIFEGNIEKSPQVEKNSWIEGEDGVYQSNDINDGESTSMTLEVEGPCDFSFDWKVSSEGNYDKLKWYVDGSQIYEISGTGSGWQTVNYSLPEGLYTLRWDYSKDGGVSNGDDCGWVRFTESVSASVTMANLFPDSYAAITNVVLTGEGTEISDGLLAGCSALESFVIPDGVTKIGANAFKDCISLVNVGMPDSIASIEDSAFSGCNLLENVMISGNVTNIGDKAFCDCNSLTSITIPSSVSRIGIGAFAGCSNIVNVSIGCFTGDSVVPGFYEAEFRSMDSFDDTLSIIDNSRGIVLSADMLTADTTDEHTMYGYAANMYFEGGIEYTFKAYYDDKSSVRIDGVTVIAAASTECRSQTYSVRYAESGWHQIELRGWNNSGGGAAYNSCEGILWRKGSESWQKFVDPGDCSRFCVNGSVVKTIKDIFPDSYNRMKGVTLTGEVTEIPENAFSGCTSLESFVIPNGVTKIGDKAFEGCVALSEIVVPDSVYSFGTKVFANCTGLMKASMPFPLKAQVETGNVFAGCSEDLEIIYREAEIKNVVAKQRYPWNGKVDISYEIEGNVFAGFSPNALPILRVTAENRETGAKYIASEAYLSGDANLLSGAHKIVWDLRADGYEFRSDEVVFSVACISVESKVFFEANSAVIAVDTHVSPMVEAGKSVTVAYNSSWIGGDPSAEVVISVDETEFMRVSGKGYFSWTPTLGGEHKLTYTTYIDGVAQDEVYETVVWVGDWRYELNDGRATITGTVHVSGDITIPSEIDGYPVVTVDENTFRGCVGLKSVTLPLAMLDDSVTMANLFPDSYTAITNVVLTGEGERIPPGAFAGCASLQNVEVPESVTQIGTGAFNGCAAMADDDGFLVVRDVLYGYFGDGDCVAIPDGVLAIEAKAFYGCDAISEVIIPSTVRRIGAEAFANCASLERVVIPISVADIGSNAFSGCNLIKDATLPGWKCGINFSNVTNLVIAEGSTNIANYAFQSCYSLESVTLPDSVTHIGYSAFSYCSNLKRVEIPDGVIAIGSYAFGSCNSELYDTTSIPGITLVDGWAIEVDKSKLPSNLDLTGIRGICGNIFQNCSSLERVVIPDGVKGIGDSAFYGCEALAEVSLPDGLTGDIKSAFSETPFIISDTFPEFILSRSGKTLYGIKTKMFDSAMDRDDVYDEMECVDILVPATVEYVGDYALGALSAYVYDLDWGDYVKSYYGVGRVIFMGSKPSASGKAFMYPWSEDDIARDEVYYYEDNDGWVWNEDWCGVKTYSLPNIPNEYKAALDCTFGRTYGGGWWTDEWISDGELMQFTEYELWYNNDVGLYGDELAFFPVMTTESSIKPYVLLDDTPAGYLDSVEIWTDEQVRRRFIPTGVSAGDWEDDDECLEYEDDDEYWCWPKDLWPDNRVVTGRKWIVVPVREVKEKWSGVSSFRVGVFGTSAISDPVLVFPVREEHEIFTKDVVSGFRGITIDGVEHLEEDEYTYWDDTIISGYQFVNWSQFENNLPMSFTITVPSAGTLVMASKYDEDESVVQAFSITGSGILSDRETEMSDDWNDLNYRWGITNFYKTGEADYVRRVKVSKGTTLTFTGVIQEDCECEFTRINFFPQESRSVAINVAYVCLEEMNGILGNEYWGRHCLKGYVKESGVYKKGETATFEAVSGEGEVFDHWEVCFGPLSLTESQRTSPRLSFVVTDEMCGDMADEAQIFLRAVWKPKYKITALPSIVGAGKVEGSGRYFAGDTVTLTATAATGCTFIKWSDGETSPTRTIEVVPADVERVIYAYFSAPDGVPDPLYWSVVFVGNGGEVGETDRLVRKGTPVGELPVPVMEGYEFLGWFTANEGGDEIRSDSVISRDLTLYARWREIPRTPTELFGGEWKSGVEGTADAGGYKDSTVAGGVSVKFSAEDASEAWIETEVTNGCRVTFSWKADCEELFKGSPYDYLSFEVDGVLQGFVCGDKDWEDKSFVVSGKGLHHLRWIFQRDEETGSGDNCAWLANVEITRIYTVEFARGEATGGEAPGALEYYEGDSVELPDCGLLVRSKHTFAGWSDGTDIYQAGEAYSNDSDTTLTPVWTRNLLQKPVISAPSVFEADTCTVEITASDGAEVRYTLDGTDPTSGSILYSGPIVISGTTTVKAIAVKDNHFDSDVSVFTVTRGVWTFGEYLNAPEYIFTDSGDAPWVRAKGVSEDGYALRSGEITHAKKSGIEMKVNGPGTISFACRVEGEIAKKIVWDGLGFYIDGVRQGDLFGNDTWETKTFNVTGTELHTLSWVYEKDDDGDGDGEDCAWLDAVVWTPAASTDLTVDVGGGKSVVVPIEWIDKYESLVVVAGGDKAAALQRTAANGRKVWECFMLGVDPTKADDDFKITRFWMEGGKPMFEFSHSTDGAGNSFTPRIKTKGKAKLSDGWSDVPAGGNSAFRFFTVEVELR